MKYIETRCITPVDCQYCGMSNVGIIKVQETEASDWTKTIFRSVLICLNCKKAITEDSGNLFSAWWADKTTEYKNKAGDKGVLFVSEGEISARVFVGDPVDDITHFCGSKAEAEMVMWDAGFFKEGESADKFRCCLGNPSIIVS